MQSAPPRWGESSDDRRQRELDAKAWAHGAVSLEDRLRIARRRFYLTATTGAATASVLVASAFFPPFLVLAIPFVIMSVDLQRKLRSLGSEGYGFWDVLSSGASTPDDHARAHAGDRPARESQASRRRDPRLNGITAGKRGVDLRERWRPLPPEATRGRHGATIRAALEDGAAILDLVERLASADREMLPEMAPTVDALIERAVALAVTLDRIDVSVTPAELPALEERIALLAADPSASDCARRLALLEHQRATILDILVRREVLAAKLESVTLLLRSLRFDLLKLRSAGGEAAYQAMTNATQQAQALSRDIGTMLEAGEEVGRGLKR